MDFHVRGSSQSYTSDSACMLNIERPIAHQSSITFFLIHPVFTAGQKYVQPFATSFGKKGIHTESEKIAFYQPITYQQTISDY